MGLGLVQARIYRTNAAWTTAARKAAAARLPFLLNFLLLFAHQHLHDELEGYRACKAVSDEHCSASSFLLIDFRFIGRLRAS